MSPTGSCSAWVPELSTGLAPVPASCLATESEMPTVSLTGSDLVPGLPTGLASESDSE